MESECFGAPIADAVSRSKNIDVEPKVVGIRVVGRGRGVVTERIDSATGRAWEHISPGNCGSQYHNSG